MGGYGNAGNRNSKKSLEISIKSRVLPMCIGTDELKRAKTETGSLKS